MESERPTVLSSMARPSWAFLLLAFTVLAILSHQISSNSLLPLWIPATRQHDPITCSGFFLHDPSPKRIVMSITDFGGVGDGKTSNTAAFRRAVSHLRVFAAAKGGAQLNVPKGTWLSGSFNLTSNFTLFLERGAVILGSQVS